MHSTPVKFRIVRETRRDLNLVGGFFLGSVSLLEVMRITWVSCQGAALRGDRWAGGGGQGGGGLACSQ